MLVKKRNILLLLTLGLSMQFALANDVLPTYDMSEDFIAAVRADDWCEKSTQLTSPTLSYDAAYKDGIFNEPQFIMRQPLGALTGKIIFSLSGHGWTYDKDGQRWVTQRSISHGLVEDFSNQDQQTIFNEYLWHAGATIVPLRPTGNQPEERVICSASPRVKYYGEWFISDSPQRYAGYPEAQGARFARASLKETALARFTPYIPTKGLYPVYTWNRDGSDRMEQTYRVRHAEGITEVYVNHRRVGKGWVYLGTYMFNTGENGCVEISNKSADPYDVDNQHVAVAETIRFGNGRSDVNLGGGITGDTRENEGSNFWLKDNAGIGVYDDFVGRSTVSDPPKTSARMNREKEGSFFDRLYFSFHTNASGSPKANARGTLALWNKDKEKRPDYQETLAHVLGNTIGKDLNDLMTSHPLKWIVRSNPAGNYINYGELRRDYLQNEMSSVLIEAAFHDNKEDAALLLEPYVRNYIARASLRGIIKWFKEVDPKAQTLHMIPQQPQNLALQVPEAGKLEISWDIPQDDPIKGDPAQETEISLLTNHITKRFRVPVSQHTLLLDGFTTGTPSNFTIYLQGVNTGGKSLPSTRLCATPAVLPNILLVDCFDSTLRSMNEHKYSETGVGGNGKYERIYLPLINNRDVVCATAEALTTAGIGFDSAQINRLETLDLNKYNTVYLLLGDQQVTSEPLFDTRVQKKLEEYIRRGGNICVAGSHAAELLPDGWAENIFSIETVRSDNKLSDVITSVEAPWNITTRIRLGNNGHNYQYVPRFVDSIKPLRRAITLATWEQSGNPAITYTSVFPRGNHAFIMCFGPELIPDLEQRTELLKGIQLGSVKTSLSPSQPNQQTPTRFVPKGPQETSLKQFLQK